VTALAGEGDPSTAPFTSFTRMAAQAAGKKTAIDLQARTGNEIQVTQSAEGLRHGTAELLALAQHAGTVRADSACPHAADLVTWEFAEIARALAARTGLGD
jgi:cytosine/adenosine deaminase-related metal-dependent hydrolase